MLYRRYKYSLSFPDGYFLVLGEIKVFWPFDADDYFPILIERNGRDIITQVKGLEPKYAELFPNQDNPSHCLIWLLDSYEEAVISATDLKTGDSILLLKRHEIDKNRYRGRKFTFSFFNDTKFDYDGNCLKRLYSRLIDRLKQQILY